METITSADGTTIALERTGNGPALVFVVGAFCDRGTSRTIAELLAEHFTVYCYDRRGRGDSGDTLPYAPAREVEDLAAVIGATGGTAHVYGHSSGAVIALEAAAGGLPVTKLAAYEPPYVVGDDRSRNADLTARVAERIAAGDRVGAIRLFLIEGVEVPAPFVDQMQGTPEWKGMEAIAHTLPYDLETVGDQIVPAARLSTITCPTLALSGGASPAWAQNAVAAVAAAVPNAEHRSLEGQTHGAADDVLAPVLVEFFQR